MKTDKLAKKGLFSAAAVTLSLGFALTGFFGCSGHTADLAPNKQGRSNVAGVEEPVNTSAFVNKYKTTAKVGYSAKELGTVERKVQKTVSNEGIASEFPVYGKTLATTLEQKQALIAECNALSATATKNASGVYDKMDAEGNLYLKGQPVLDKDGKQRKLYKHTAAEGMYLGNVSDSEPAIAKTVTFKKRGYEGYGVTGMYAPAGEVITVKISKEDMEATGGITVHIGQALYNGKANNIWDKKEMVRMPVILNTMSVDKETATLGEDGYYTAYVGSFLGGPVYIRNENVTFSVTLSGGVRYSHFILGYTTEEEFELNRKSSAPYFDLEVWDNGVLHSGPRTYAEAFDYEDLHNVAVYWDKVALVSTKVTTQGIVFLYDPFVAAGAAVAFPGQMSVNCPMSWMVGSLDYDSLVTTGAWGNMHEYNHNFQSGWGRGEGGEVTNNALNLVEYSLFTRISAARAVADYGSQGLSDWNKYTSASFAVAQAIGPTQTVAENKISRDNDLSVYAAVLHSFGPDLFIKAIQHQKKQGYGVSPDGWCKAVSEVTHNDMTYYFSDLVGYSISETTKEAVRKLGYPVFVPVASVYQTGVKYAYDGKSKEINTVQPYQIEWGKEFTLDMSRYTTSGKMYKSGSVVMPDRFSYTIKSFTTPANGTLTKTGDYTFVYKPGKEADSGKFTITIELTPPEGSTLGKITKDIVIELRQSHDLNRNVLERTTYDYSTKVYETAEDAYNKGFAGYETVTKGDSVNSVQNSNTDLWYKPEEYSGTNRAVLIEGKLYADESAKYRLAIRGRWNVAVYTSTDNVNFELAAKFERPKNQTDPNFSTSAETYKDFELEAGTWLYFKEVMIAEKSGNYISFVGLGWGKFTPGVPILENGNVVGETQEKVDVRYANAFRNSYEMPAGEYQTEYFYTKDYAYDYSEINDRSADLKVIDTNYNPWTSNVESGLYDIAHLTDKDKNTSIHSVQNVLYDGANGNSLYFVFDLGSVGKVNEATFYAIGGRTSNLGMPNNFEIFGKKNESDDYVSLGKYEDYRYSGTSFTVTFTETEARYIKLEITRSDTHRYLALGEITFAYSRHIDGGTLHSTDEEMFSYTGDWATKSTISTFGHVFVGGKNAQLTFTFTGERLAIFTSEAFGRNFTVYIDGKVAASEPVKAPEDGTAVAFLSAKLASGAHTVTVKCNAATAIDSIALW